MSANRWGERFAVTTFGESHGPALGVVIDGCPAGVIWDSSLMSRELERRRPGQKSLSGAVLVSPRNEPDLPEVLSGVFEGKTLGTPIAVMVRNTDARSGDYTEENLKSRVGHADDLWRLKFGHSDPRGSGRASGRETVARVMAGAVARMFLSQHGRVGVMGWVSQVGPYVLTEKEQVEVAQRVEESVRADQGASYLKWLSQFPAAFPSKARANLVEKLLVEARTDGKSYGGAAQVMVVGSPLGLGQPVAHKLKADLASAWMSVGAAVSVELGEGHAAAGAEGTQFHGQAGVYGGIRGGISTGEVILGRVVFKPTSSVLHVAKSGRHDPCIVQRALPVLESMAALVFADHILWSRGDRC